MNDSRGVTKDAYKILYIDDELARVERMQGIFAAGKIDEFVASHAGVLSDDAVALLKKVELVGILNNPTDEQLAFNQQIPRWLDKDEPEYLELEKKMSPANRAARDIYDGQYDVVITDMGMPAADSYTVKKFEGTGGGGFIANVAKLADVPVIIHSMSSHDEIVDCIKANSPTDLVYENGPSEHHARFSDALLTPHKGNQLEIYQAVVATLEKLGKPQQMMVA